MSFVRSFVRNAASSDRVHVESAVPRTRAHEAVASPSALIAPSPVRHAAGSIRRHRSLIRSRRPCCGNRLAFIFYRMKVRDVIHVLADDGWYLARTRGSHQQFKHATKPGLVTVAGHPSDELAPGTLNSILRQAGLKP